MKSILYVQFTDPAVYPPLQHSAHLLADRGWSVHFVGVEPNTGACDLRMRPHSRITMDRLGPTGRGPRLAATYARFLARCRREILMRRPDVVYCSDVRSYPVGLWASYRSGIKTVLHEHDPPSARGSKVARALGGIRRRFAQRATVCIIPQADRAAGFRAATGARSIAVAYNCPARREISGPPPATAHDRLVLWYHGSIGPGQLPDSVIAALARLPRGVRLEFAGYETVSTTGYVSHLIAMSEHLGVGDRVAYRGPLPLRSELLAAATTAHAGLALFARTFRDPMVGASNKPFEYLACGLPLVTNDTEEWRAFFGAAGVAIGCDPDSPDDIARAVRWLLDHPDERRAMAKRGRDRVLAEWHYEHQFQPVVDVLEAEQVLAERKLATGAKAS